MPFRVIDDFGLCERGCETHTPLRNLEARQYSVEILGCTTLKDHVATLAFILTLSIF